MKMKPQQQAGGIGGRMVYPNTNNVRPTGSVGIVSRAAAAGNNSFPGVNNSNYANAGNVKPVEINIPDFLKNPRR